jgi:hypothetical protein
MQQGLSSPDEVRAGVIGPCEQALHPALVGVGPGRPCTVAPGGFLDTCSSRREIPAPFALLIHHLNPSVPRRRRFAVSKIRQRQTDTFAVRNHEATMDRRMWMRKSRCGLVFLAMRAKKEGDSDPPWHRYPVCRPPWKRRKEYYERVSSISGFYYPLHPKYSSALDRGKNGRKILAHVSDGSDRVGPPGQLPLVARKSIHYDRATTTTVAKDPNEDCRCYRFPTPC